MQTLRRRKGILWHRRRVRHINKRVPRGAAQRCHSARALPSPPSARWRGARVQAGERGLRRARLGGRTRTHGGRPRRGSHIR